ncbi:glutaredoxin family protein [Trinickia fusca]|uniref:Glutaredoxin family protein n=1 Tax=Trinickia fusca TaxID=2419777 RepID=A0A494XQH0_9BURK|nr:glutaredoxin family protein [Trinickia fusca]RKP52052.1 glutaredoxin family protein [Trinickia fusca]
MTAPQTPRLMLYGRAWCHLCEEMQVALEPLLAEFDMPVEVVDIDTDAELEARYDELVPVLVWDGQELCRYRLDAAHVRAVLESYRASR